MDLSIALWTTFFAVISSPSSADPNYVQISTYDDSLPSRETQHRGGVEDDLRSTRGECSTLQFMMNYKLSQQLFLTRPREQAGQDDSNNTPKPSKKNSTLWRPL